MSENLINQLKKLNPKDYWQLDKDGLTLTHPTYHAELEFEAPLDEQKVIEDVTHFLSCKYQSGKLFYYDGYFEILIQQTGYETYLIENGPDISPKEEQDKSKIYYEIGTVSDIFSALLETDISSDIFSQEHYQSFKLYNVKFDLMEKDNKIQTEKFLADSYYLTNIAFFDIYRKSGLALSSLDLSGVEDFGFNLEGPDLEEIKTTEIEAGKYDTDLLRYFNRASTMPESEFKYIAYFQVLECIFDEVYLYETVQDAKSIIDSNWFRTNEFDHVSKLVAIIDRFNKEQNDRSKIKLVLDRFFKLKMHDDAFLLANKEIIQNLIELDAIKKEEDFKDVQKIANAIYDIRNEYTHSNRAFPKRRELEVKSSDLSVQINIIRAIAETIVINYRK